MVIVGRERRLSKKPVELNNLKVPAEQTIKNFNVFVAVRVRPSDPPSKHKPALSCPGNAQIVSEIQGTRRVFSFDVVFEREATQKDVFDESGVRDLIQLAVEGYSCTCLAYGQTNSGKTYTMTGPPEFVFGNFNDITTSSQGVIPRAFDVLFNNLRRNSDKMISYKVYATYFEIYNEQVVDLLNPRSLYQHSIRMNSSANFYVENLYIIECDSAADLMGVLTTGLRNRSTDESSANKYSSRSHSLFTIMVDSEVKDSELGDVVTRHGKLSFVDLAGSETINDANNLTPEHLQETSSINRSLLVLGNCIASLTDQKKKHVPYRDSKLTKILSDSLGGNGISLMIACVNPNEQHSSETVNTLRYASRTKKIITSPEVKLDTKEELLRSLQREVESLKSENNGLKEQLRYSESTKSEPQPPPPPAAPSPPRPVSELQRAVSKASKNSYSSLYEMLQEYMQENEVLKNENMEMNKYRTEFRKEQDLLAQENKRLAIKLDKLYRQIEATKQAIAASQKPIYVSNPESRASPIAAHLPKSSTADNKNHNQKFPPIRKKSSELLSLTSSDQIPPSLPSNQFLPSIVAPPSSNKSEVSNQKPMIANTLSYSDNIVQQARHQLYIPESNNPTPYQNSEPNLMPVAYQFNNPPVYYTPQPQQQYITPEPYRPVPAPQHLPYEYHNPVNSPVKHHPPAPMPQHDPTLRYYPEGPVHLPKEGEQTYRARFQASSNPQKPASKLQSQSKTSVSSDKLNESLRHELRTLDGAIQQHQRVNSLNRELRKEGRKVLRTY